VKALARTALVGITVAGALAGGTAVAQTGHSTSAGPHTTPHAAAAGGAASNFVPMTPCTAVDMRAIGPIQAGSSVQVNFTYDGGLGGDPACTVPANATAVQATLLAFNPTGSGYLTAWPTGTTEPGAALLTYTKDVNASSGTTLTLNQGGSTVRVNTSAATLGINIEGYYVAPPPSPSVLVASVDDSGHLLFGSHATSAVLVNGGQGHFSYQVLFDRDVASQCAYQLTPHAAGGGVTANATALDTRSDAVGVSFQQSPAGSGTEQDAFDLTVTCL